MFSTVLHRSLLLAAIAQASLFAETPSVRVPQSSSIISSRSVASSSGGSVATAAAMAGNRARTLGDQLSGSLTRYRVINDASVRGVSDPKQLAGQLRGPQVSATDPVRNVVTVVDLRQPLNVQTVNGQTLRIGTTQVDPHRVTNLSVTSLINVQKLHIQPK